jgi:hypothetical protein
MKKNLVVQELQDLTEDESITSATISTDQSSCLAGRESIADAKTDQDNAEPGILFRPQLRFVSL